MLIFAVSDVVWQALIAAAVTVILAAMQMWAKRSADRAAVAAGNAATAAGKAATSAATAVVKVAAHAEEVKTALAESDAITNEKLADVAEKVEAVHKATNSLTDRLVESTDKAAHSRGVEEERERNKPREN